MTGAWGRLRAVFVKEAIQLARDRITFAMMVFIPLVQLVLFGYAINNDPRRLPTVVLSEDDSAFSRSFLSAMQASSYFDVRRIVRSENELDRALLDGSAVFAVQVPAGFGRRVVRGERPSLLLAADATDPTATGAAAAAIGELARRAVAAEARGPLARLGQAAPAFDVRVHKRWNPAGETRLNIVPGLMGTILTLTMLIFTALSVTREIERGTMETLLAMPVGPVEIMAGKIAPYLVVGGIQMAIILGAGWLMFGVPVEGSLLLLVGLTLLFILANLAVGYTFSTIAQSQLQAMQMSFFFFLPNLLLSGFMFPFRGMPGWAQAIGEVLPLTHYLRIVRGVMLKGAGLAELSGDTIALAAFALAMMALAAVRFRRTLD